MSKWIGLVCLFIATAMQGAAPAWKPEVPATQVKSLIPPSVATVNCTNGEKVQAAVDRNRGPVTILITGICVENVLIRDKDVTLRGTTKPLLDGIRSAVNTTPALIVSGPVQGAIEDLSFSNSAGLAVSIRGANMTLANCLFMNNSGSGLQVNAGGFVTAEGLTFSGNTGRSVNVSDAQFFCTGCDVSGNNFAVLATRGAIVSMLDSVITGRRGILSIDGGTYADIDCATTDTPHDCGMQVTGVAAQAIGGGVAALYAAGDFTGQVSADDRGTVYVLGARQISGALPGQGPAINTVDFFGTIVASAFFDFDPPAQSLLRDVDAAHFGRVLVTDDTLLKGSIQCSSAADAWLDPTVIVDGTVTGCDHASVRGK
jgi:parallel beta helix pectate lyase-like protein